MNLLVRQQREHLTWFDCKFEFEFQLEFDFEFAFEFDFEFEPGSQFFAF